jgi:gamma-glutamylcyclotransferase (GGCT)/AIG2-like uncharacterized protein YtfP
MKIKQIIKLFIPPIIIYFINLFRNNKKENILPFYSTINNHKKNTDKIIILGNGPSLKNQLANSIDILKSNQCVCVNSFVLTEYYSIIKPRVYLLIDPSFFVQCAVLEIEQEHISVFNNLFIKTTWNVDLVVSSKYKDNDRILKLKENHHINILFINQDDYIAFNTKEEQFKLLNKNKIRFPAQTVLNTAVYLCIFWKYKNIILLGADTSWHEELRIDQKTNILYINDEHFYGTKKRIIYSDTLQTIPSKLHQELFAIARALEYYCLLREYADYNSVFVYNASEKSWIDAFERKELESF